MSGGSMDYLCYKVEEASFVENTPERKAFKRHLSLVAKALKEIEWCDSCDTSPGEDTKAIMQCISKQEVLSTIIEEAKEIKHQLEKYLND